MNKIISMILLSTTLLGCGTKELQELNLTYVKAPLNVPAIINYEEDFVSKKVSPTKVSYHEINSGAQQTEAMVAKSVDIATVLGSTSAILAASQGNDLQIIGMFSRAPKAFMIMAKNPTLTNMSSLKGKKIGGPKGTVLHQLLIAALKKEGMTTNDIEFFSMDIPQALSGILGGDLDAALLGGSATTLAEEEGAHVVITGEGLIDGATVIAARGELISNHPEVVQEYLASHQESLVFMNTNPETAYLYTSSQVGLTTNQVKSLIGDYNFNPIVTAQDISNLNNTQDFLYEEGLLERKINIDELISPLAPR